MEEIEEIGPYLMQLRIKHGLTRNQLIRATGLAAESVKRIENGHIKNPSWRTVLKILDTLGYQLLITPYVQVVQKKTDNGKPIENFDGNVGGQHT